MYRALIQEWRPGITCLSKTKIRKATGPPGLLSESVAPQQLSQYSRHGHRIRWNAPPCLRLSHVICQSRKHHSETHCQSCMRTDTSSWHAQWMSYRTVLTQWPWRTGYTSELLYVRDLTGAPDAETASVNLGFREHTCNFRDSSYACPIFLCKNNLKVWLFGTLNFR